MVLRAGEHNQATLIVGANLGIVEYREGDSAEAVRVLSGAYDELSQQLGQTSPQAQSFAFYLACALGDIGRFDEAAKLLPSLTAADLASAEPRTDWEPRLEALRGYVLAGQGNRQEGVSRLKAAIEKMEAGGASALDLQPFKQMLNH